MIRVDPKVPDDCSVSGYLYFTSDKTGLSEDMIEIILPNGILVTGGWGPEGIEDGFFNVVATCGCEIIMKGVTRNVDVAGGLCEEFVYKLLL